MQVRHKDGWLKFDDETVSCVSEDDILRLSGGGDWHCAYLLIYGPRVLREPVEGKKSETAADDTEVIAPPLD